MLDLCTYLSWYRWDDFFHCRKQYYGQRTRILAGRNILKLQIRINDENCFLQTCRFSLHNMLIDGLESSGLLVYYCDVFISCLKSHFDGTHSLQMIHWWASDVMIHFFKPVLINSSTSWIAYNFQQIYIFGWTITLRHLKPIANIFLIGS